MLDLIATSSWPARRVLRPAREFRKTRKAKHRVGPKARGVVALGPRGPEAPAPKEPLVRSVKRILVPKGSSGPNRARRHITTTSSRRFRESDSNIMNTIAAAAVFYISFLPHGASRTTYVGSKKGATTGDTVFLQKLSRSRACLCACQNNCS